MELWQVYLLAALLGVVNLFDNPARQTFVMEMVGRDDLPNAVSLNTVVMNASRVIGPAIGGVVITLFGLGVCFFVNAASYVAVLVGLSMMRTAELRRPSVVPRAKGQIREGFRYVWRTPSLRNTLLAVALIGIFAYNFTVTLALLAKVTFHGGAGTYSLLTSCMGIGAVAGGLIAAHRARPTPRLLQVLALVFGGLLAAVALAPTLVVAAVLIVLMGAASIGFIATANATLQLSSDPAMRGRVMALYAMAFLGTTPIGAPLVGAIAQWTNPRIALLSRRGGHGGRRRRCSCGATRPRSSRPVGPTYPSPRSRLRSTISNRAPPDRIGYVRRAAPLVRSAAPLDGRNRWSKRGEAGPLGFHAGRQDEDQHYRDLLSGGDGRRFPRGRDGG